MAVSSTLEVVGIKDALRELNKIDKSARRALTKRYQEVVRPIVDEIQSNIPKQAPLSGWNRSWDPSAKRGLSARLAKRDAYAAVLQEQARAEGRNQLLPWQYNPKAVKARVSGKKPRKGAGRFTATMEHLATFTITWTGPQARLFDISGRNSFGQGSGRAMINALNARFGNASRLVWRAYDNKQDTVEDAIREIVKDLMKQVGQGGKL